MKAAIALVRRAVAFELAQYRSLFRWVTGRPDVPSDAVAFAYIGAVEVLLGHSSACRRSSLWAST